MDDAKIIELFNQRDERAILETQTVHGERLMRLAERILGRSGEAEECVSDTCLKAWETIPPVRPVSLAAYLLRICRNFAFGRLDWQQAEKRRAEVVSLTEEMEMCIPDRRAEEEMEGREIGRLISVFLRGLPEEARLIFVRRYWFADSIREISLRYGMGESKVKTSLHRTRTKLRDFLEREGIVL